MAAADVASVCLDIWYCPACRTRHVVSTLLVPMLASFAADIHFGGKRHREKWQQRTCCGQVRDATPKKPKAPEQCCSERLRYAGRVSECL